MQKIVIVGAGIASLTAAEALRQNGFEGKITILGEENTLPYQRPPLSKAYLTSDELPSPTPIRSPNFFRDNNIEFEQGCEVTALDRTAKQVVIQGGRKVQYDILILATGARPRPIDLPGENSKNVFYLRNFDHSAALRNALSAPEHKKVAILGAGVIGLEVASAANLLGKQVSVFEASSRAMCRVASPLTTNFVTNRMALDGVSFCFNACVNQILSEEDRVSGIRLSDGTTKPADVVVIGIGAVPNAELAQDANLSCDGGILVDSNMCSSDPDIFAIGDCAKAVNLSTNTPIRIETIHNAMLQAQIAAAHICGKPSPPISPPRFWSDLNGMKVQCVGIATGYDRIQQRPTENDNAREFWLFSGDRMIAAETVNLPTRQSKLSEALSER
ncbi:NAD(P)/FAD-dependent oxidoreductase [Halioxenophilus aromaticivorans]|jgi:NADPH-dependent 2,4-dienoyl-CoA reductase/sulfur reductase-like enzyme|uniref:FAD-dependent oxidoreductase n=1 Tax=Halioxenophilus aromaticivorans TaxID=1306992 RepID=A0AAV3U7K1_9ALTE